MTQYAFTVIINNNWDIINQQLHYNRWITNCFLNQVINLDIRIYKTKKSIYDAFIELRSKKELRKITVRELCETALINKSTFYSYYEDIFDLEDKIESEVVENIINSITHPENMIDDPAKFYQDLLAAMTENHNAYIINTVFSGVQHPNLVEKISKSLNSVFFKFHPELEQNRKFCIMLDYAIYGGYYAFEEDRTKSNPTELTNTIAEITDHMSKLMRTALSF